MCDMSKSIVIHSNRDQRRFFRSTDHCQGVRSPETYPDGYSVCTISFPHHVAPRPILPSGIVETVADVLAVCYGNAVEIPNPDSKYQPVEG